MTAPTGDRTADLRLRADQLRDVIASRAIQIRRDGREMISRATRRPAGQVPLRGLPSWVLAAAAGAVAGLAAAVRRRRSKPKLEVES